MPINTVHYELHEGYVDHWLVAGPQVRTIDDPERCTLDGWRDDLIAEYYEPQSGITETPVERGPLTEGVFQIGDYEGAWSYVRCGRDHLVDLSDIYPEPVHLRAWAYAQLVVPTEMTTSLVVTAFGPVDVWLNGQHVHHDRTLMTDASEGRVRSTEVNVTLKAGANEILVRFEQIGNPLALALRLPALAERDEGVQVLLPTTIKEIRRRNRLEQIFYDAYLDQAVYGREDEIRLRWPASMKDLGIYIIARLQDTSGKVYIEGDIQKAGKGMNFGKAYRFREDHYHLVLMPQQDEYYIGDVRITRTLDLWALDNNGFSEAVYSTFNERRAELLLRAARGKESVYTEIAKMAISWWSRLKPQSIKDAIERINRRRPGSVIDLIGLLSMVCRYGDYDEFPVELLAPIKSCALGFRYRGDEPGCRAIRYEEEGRRILLHACEVLAGQLYSDAVFANSGQTGEWHRTKGEELTLAWMRTRATGGFAAWDSPATFEEMFVALSQLLEFADRREVWESAAILIDKLLFTVAVNSYKGVFGSTRGYAISPAVKSGLLSPTGGISRLMWGQGIFNHHLAGSVSLACMEEYGFPRIIQAIAADQPEELWHRERHAPEGSAVEVNKVTYKTPDYMLASAQDYRPGELGGCEHIWQATMGPAALVFVNHPVCVSENPARRPNFWRGNGVLPRVAQWKDALIAIYRLPDDDWMGLTHAYFPTYAFDEYEIHDGWAFARKGDGYLALTSSQGLELTESGDHAYRELRSPGRRAVWVCQMGRASLDGDFVAFKEKVSAMDRAFDDLSIAWRTLRDESLSFGWDEPLLRDGEPQQLDGFEHYEGPYSSAALPADVMEIRFGDQMMRLVLEPEDGM